MPDEERPWLVTGAFSYTGKYVAERLLAQGVPVRTLTGHRDRPHPFGTSIVAHPYAFDDHAALLHAFQGVHTFFNSYWIRYPHGDVTYDRAVANTSTLVRAAQEAGVRRIVHVSITNPSLDSPFPYFRGKAQQEEAIRTSGVPHVILRPTLVFGPGDVLVNNMAWFLRRFPLFPVPGDGAYRVQPISVDDVARLAVELADAEGDLVADAAGPETYTFSQMLRLIAAAVERRPRLVHVPKGLALLLTKPFNWMLGDIVLTRDEVDGLAAGLLVSEEPPRGVVSFQEWLRQEGRLMGARYASELQRHFR